MDQFSELAFGREDSRFLGEELSYFYALLDLFKRHFELRNAFEHGEERLLVQFFQCVGGGVAEQDVGSLDRSVVVLFGVHHDGDLLGQSLLERTQVRSLFLLLDERVDFLVRKAGEDLDVFLGVFVGYVQPELVELVRRGVSLVQPYVAGLRLSELLAVGLRDERAGEGERLVACHFADHLGSGGDVAPLVRATQLEFAVLVAVQVYEVISLGQLVGELGEGHSVRTVLARETSLHGVFRHHVVDRDELTHVPDEIEEGEVLHPVVVVHQLGRVLRLAVEVEEFL